MLENLITEMVGRDSTEFKNCTMLLPIDDYIAAQTLANAMGVPTSRILAELVLQNVGPALKEWYRFNGTDPVAERLSIDLAKVQF